jgi:hypothetical protein
MTNTTGTGQKRKAQSKASSKSARRTSAPKKSGSGSGRRGTTTGRAAQGLHVHTVHASIPLPYVTKDDLSANVLHRRIDPP